MNRDDRLTELRKLQGSQPVAPSPEFDTWQARVSALIGFDRLQQDRFRHLASSATIPGHDFFQSCMRQMEQILLQAIADLEVGPEVAAEPPAEPGKPIRIHQLFDSRQSDCRGISQPSQGASAYSLLTTRYDHNGSSMALTSWRCPSPLHCSSPAFEQ